MIRDRDERRWSWSIVLILQLLFARQTDVGRARCWLKIALNNHTIESSIMVGRDGWRVDALASC